MGFHITHRLGHMEVNPERAAFFGLLQELELGRGDEEHTSVAVTHESEWCLGAYADGYVIFENLEEGDPRHMAGVSEVKVIELWNLLADGKLDVIEQEPWLPGY